MLSEDTEKDPKTPFHPRPQPAAEALAYRFVDIRMVAAITHASIYGPVAPGLGWAVKAAGAPIQLPMDLGSNCRHESQVSEY